MPVARVCGRHYLTKTLEESYQLYKEECIRKGNKGVSFSTFCKLHPKNIYKIGQTLDCQCICDQCKNFWLLQQAFKYNQIKGIAPHTKLCIQQRRCTVESNAQIVMQTDYTRLTHHMVTLNVLQGIVRMCSPDYVLLEILKANLGIEESDEMIEFNHWDWIKKKGLSYKRLGLITDRKKKIDVVNMYIRRSPLHGISSLYM